MTTTIPPALADAMSRKRLLVLCGAGVSMLPPSNLPSWWGFNQSILDEAKRITLEGFPDLDKRAKEKIDGLSLNHLSVVSFSETLVSTFAGSGYFPVLELLDSDRTNASHRALAELGRRRIASVFVTTNFDTLIERSFRQSAVPLRVYVSEGDYVADDVAGDGCELYKIHGTVKSVTSLVDTVTQKLRGIPLEVRGRLATLFRNYYVLVLGYSGADLEFGDDYLALSAIDEHGPGITWVVRPGTQPSERVRRVVERAGARGQIVEASLPDFFEELGVTVIRPPSADDESSRAEAESRTRERIREFFAQPYVGLLSSVSFCVRLIRSIGDELTTEALLKSLAVHPQVAGPEVHMSAAIAYNALSGWALQKHEFHEAVYWLQRDLELHRKMAQMYAADGREVPPSVALEWRRNLTAVYNNLGLGLIQLKEFESARRALDEARKYAEEARESAGLSLVYLNMAQLEKATGGESDQILRLLRIARAFAKDCGMAQTIYESNTNEAQTLMSIAEYDEAYARLSEAEQYVLLDGGIEGRLALDVTRAELALRRGGLDAARETFRACVALAEGRGSQTLADKIRFTFCLHLGFHFRQEVLDELNRLAARHRNGVACAVPLESVEEVARILSDEENPVDKPSFELVHQDRDDEESQVRMGIALCEYQQDLASLPPNFAWLCEKKFEEGNPDRLLNLASAFLAAAERARNPEQCAEARNYIGIARSMLGDTKGAVDAYRSALATDNLPPQLRLRLKLNCALVQSKSGEPAEAEALFRELIAAYQGQGDFDGLIHAMRGLAQHFLRQERFQEAAAQLEVALTYCEKATPPEARETIEADLKHVKRRLEAQVSGLFQGRERKIVVDWPEGRKQLDGQQLAALRSQARTAEEFVNLGLLAAESGFMQEARALKEEALSLFKDSGDELGAARCLRYLGSVAYAEGRLAQATEYAERGLEILYRLEDIAGQVLLRSDIASYYLADGDDEQAREHAAICLRLAERLPPSRSVATAWHVLVSVNAAAARRAEALRCMEQFVKTYEHIDAPDLEALYKEYARLLSEVERLVPPDELSPQEIEATGREAMRLKEVGDYEGALKLLDDLEGRCRTVEERARVEANRGNVFQTSGRHGEAVEYYRRSAELFRECGLQEWVEQVEIQCAASMREGGDADGAASILRALLERLPPGPQRVHAINALCNTLLRLLMERGRLDEESLERVSEAYLLFDEARTVPGQTAEALGTIEVNSANFLILEGKTKEALDRLDRARQYFLRCNSQHLDQVESLMEYLQQSTNSGEREVS